MSGLNQVLSVIYNNLYTYFDYKEIIPLENKIEDTEFIKHIYNNEYYVIKTYSKHYSDDDVNIIKTNINNMLYKNTKELYLTYVVLFHYNSELYTKSQDFKKILNNLKKSPFKLNIIFITKIPLTTHVKNYINSIKNQLNIINYTYNLFTIIIPKHILSNKHIILSKEEEEHLLNDVLFTTKHNIPKIKITDPQIIWSPGKVGDIVAIERLDDITGQSLYYRVIIK